MVTRLKPSPPRDFVDLPAHERTYRGFNTLIHWCMVMLAASLLMLTMWFATPAGFFGGLIVGVLVTLAGYFGLIRREARQPLDPWTPGR